MRLAPYLASLWLVLTGCQEPGTVSGAPGAGSGPSPAGPVVHSLTPSSDPGEVDDTLIAHIHAEDYEKAYELMTTAYQDSVPLEVFAASVSHNRYLRTVQLIGCSEVRTLNGTVHVRECVLESEAGDAAATLYYAREDVGWRMTGMLIGGTPAFPGPRSTRADGDDAPRRGERRASDPVPK